ncbi:hypothetical protein LDB17_14080 [Dysgonomonas sp. Shenzhen-Wh21]
MKKVILLFVLLSVCFIHTYSQNQLLVLDNYTIPLNNKGAVVGKVISTGNEKITLKDPSGLFEIDKEKNIKLKKGKQLTANSPISYKIILKEGKNEKSFELVKDEFLHNKVIAHRGAWKDRDFSHNSMSSLKHAVEIGCEGSELDVWM